MVELRLRTKTSKEELESKVGKLITDADYNLLLTRQTKVLKPDGQPLCIYLPGVLKERATDVYPVLRTVKVATDNRGLASGSKRASDGRRTRSKPVHSAILGGMDYKGGGRDYCRLTSYTVKNWDKWEAIRPFLQEIVAFFKICVPDRFAAQITRANHTDPDWIITGTPFTTVTINNTYPTGVHTDKGDLHEGFSCLATVRRGLYSGGVLVFPEYRVGVDMEDGDLLLMDAHEFHGNTQICKHSDDAERISVVCYYRTEMENCGSLEEEDAKREARAERSLST